MKLTDILKRPAHISRPRLVESVRTGSFDVRIGEVDIEWADSKSKFGT